MIKKAAIVVVSGLILMVAFAFLIYPTPYKYVEFKSGDNTWTAKSNRITGKTQFYVVPRGWVDEHEPEVVQGN